MRELYARPDRAMRDIVRGVVAALDPETRAGMSDPAVVTCLGVLVEGTQRVGTAGLAPTLTALGVAETPAAVQMAAGLRARAEQLITEQHCASRFGDLAVEAMGSTALALASLQAEGAGLLELPLATVEASFASLAGGHQLHRVARTFVGHKLDRTFRYFVSRDLADFVGEEGVPTVTDANLLEDAVAAHCRECAAAVALAQYENLLSRTAGMDPVTWVPELTPVMAAGISQGLTMLAEGG